MEQAALETEPKPEAMAFICSHVKDSTERQLQDSDALDSKAIQALAAASVVMGLGGFSLNLHPCILKMD